MRINTLFICFMLLMLGANAANVDAEQILNTDLEEYAISDFEVTDETLYEASSMLTSVEANLRFLQLQRSVDRAISQMKIVSDEFISSEQDHDYLASLIERMELIKAEIESYTETQSPMQSAEMYVLLKTDAIETLREFREFSKENIPEAKKAGLKDKMNAVSSDVDSSYDERIKKAIEAKNREHLADLLYRLGITEEDVMMKIRLGEISIGQARSDVVRSYSALRKEEQEKRMLEMRSMIKEREERQNGLSGDLKVMVGYSLGDEISERIRERISANGRYLGMLEERMNSDPALKQKVMQRIGGG